jgi:Fe-S-cluster-containing dehydrogenase component
MLRRIKIRNGFTLENPCGIKIDNNYPMVGCRYCKTQCPYYNGEVKILFWNFVKCKR